MSMSQRKAGSPWHTTVNTLISLKERLVPRREGSVQREHTGGKEGKCCLENTMSENLADASSMTPKTKVGTLQAKMPGDLKQKWAHCGQRYQVN